MSDAPPTLARRSGAVLAFAHLYEPVSAMLRSLILARVLPVEEFALAFALSSVIALAEMISDVGLQPQALRMSVHAGRARGTLHSLGFMRASALALLVVAASPLVAALFHRPDAWLAFALAGPALLARGLINLSFKQAQRDLDFWPEALTIIASQSVWTLVAVLASLYFQDHRGMVTGLIAYGVCYALVSNLMAKYPFRLAWEWSVAREAWVYGWPLLPNGGLLTISALGDRFVVASILGLYALGVYSPVVALAVLPRGGALRFLGSLFLPRAIRAHEAGETQERVMRHWTIALCATGIVLALGYFLGGRLVIRLAFGSAYVPSQLLISLFAALIAARIIVAHPQIVALAQAKTRYVTLSSAVPAFALLPATLILLHFRSLEAFVAALLVCETIGLFVIIYAAVRAFRLDVKLVLSNTYASMALVLVIILLLHSTVDQLTTEVIARRFEKI